MLSLKKSATNLFQKETISPLFSDKSGHWYRIFARFVTYAGLAAAISKLAEEQ
jgi:hypothetical protein